MSLSPKRKARITAKRRSFVRERLPQPTDYFEQQGMKLRGQGEWRTAHCPLHDDHRPSLRVRPGSGAFRCMACGAHGGDVVSFHMQRYQLSFKEAACALGAWENYK